VLILKPSLANFLREQVSGFLQYLQIVKLQREAQSRNAEFTEKNAIDRSYIAYYSILVPYVKAKMGISGLFRSREVRFRERFGGWDLA